MGDGEDINVDDNTSSNGDAYRDLELPVDAVTDPGRLAELAFKEERQAHYGKWEKTAAGKSSFKGKTRADLEVRSPMDDFINAHAYITCRRMVPEVYFGNDQTCEF